MTLGLPLSAHVFGLSVASADARATCMPQTTATTTRRTFGVVLADDIARSAATVHQATVQRAAGDRGDHQVSANRAASGIEAVTVLRTSCTRSRIPDGYERPRSHVRSTRSVRQSRGRS